jgi:hypothetical protein
LTLKPLLLPHPRRRRTESKAAPTIPRRPVVLFQILIMATPEDGKQLMNERPVSGEREGCVIRLSMGHRFATKKQVESLSPPRSVVPISRLDPNC